jgi:hypothetical protein
LDDLLICGDILSPHPSDELLKCGDIQYSIFVIKGGVWGQNASTFHHQLREKDLRE